MRGAFFALLVASTTASAAPLVTPTIHWSVKSSLTRTHDEKAQALAEGKFSLPLSNGYRCDFTPTSRTETPAAIIFTRVMACVAPDGKTTTGTSASCTVPLNHGVAPIVEPGKWFVFATKEGSPFYVTLTCGFVSEP